MKNGLLAIAFLLMTVVTVNAQLASTAIPTGFQPVGTNSSSTVDATEDIDLVTVNSVLSYWVMPSLNAPSTTTWVWTTKTGTATIASAAPSQTATVTFPTVESGKINAAQMTTCLDPTGTDFNYQVIKAPEVGYSDASLTANVGICNFTTDQVINIALVSYIPSMVAANETMNVTYTIQKDGANVATGTNISQALKASDTKITIPIAQFGTIASGTYTITFSKVDDRILRKATNKASLNGTITAAKATYTINVIAPPVTGKIYHLPNA